MARTLKGLPDMTARFRALCLGLSATFGLAASAHATIINRDFHLTASGFTLECCSPNAAPVDPVTLDITLNFDNSADVQATTAGMTLNSFNLLDTVQFAYTSATDGLTIATDIPDLFSCNSHANSFCAFIHDATSANPDLIFFQQVTSSSGAWRPDTMSLTFTDRVTGRDGGVPEPAAWAMMLLGFGGIGATLRAQRVRPGPVAA
jgi:hypothetical protein